MAAQSVEPRIPEFFVAGQPCGGLADALGRQHAAHDPAFLLAGDQAGLFEHPYVLHEADERHAVRRRQVADAARAACERLQRAAAGRVCQRAKDKVEFGIFILNHKVKFSLSRSAYKVLVAPSLGRTDPRGGGRDCA